MWKREERGIYLSTKDLDMILLKVYQTANTTNVLVRCTALSECQCQTVNRCVGEGEWEGRRYRASGGVSFKAETRAINMPLYDYSIILNSLIHR